MGSSAFAQASLQALLNSSLFTVSCVITAPDRPGGRKQKLIESPIKLLAKKHRLALLQPKKIKATYHQLKKLKPDLIVLAAYGQIIPKKILDLPGFGCVNLHPSLLPYYRGPSPIQTAILNNEPITGISLILMDEKIDHGPILAQKKVPISFNDNAQTLSQKLAQKGAHLLIRTLPDYLQGKIKLRKQNHAQATSTKPLTRQDGEIDWKDSAQKIARQIRALYPWPGAWTYLNKQRVKILKAKAVAKKQPAALKTGQGFLLLEIVQPAGKKPMTGQDYFRGH